MSSIDSSRQHRTAGTGSTVSKRSRTRLNRLFAAAACMLVLVIMTTIMIQIVYRFVLDDPVAWVLDITIFLLMFVFFLAVAPALQSNSHIEVDMFDSLIPKRRHKTVRLIGKLLTVRSAQSSCGTSPPSTTTPWNWTKSRSRYSSSS